MDQVSQLDQPSYLDDLIRLERFKDNYQDVRVPKGRMVVLYGDQEIIMGDIHQVEGYDYLKVYTAYSDINKNEY